MEQKSRSNCFTCYGLEEELTRTEFSDMLKKKGATYFVLGWEICPKTKRNHCQGYVHWRSPRSFKAVCNYWKGWHVEATKGTNTQAIEYCKKDNVFTEWGETPVQGKRNDLSEIKKLIVNEGRTVSQLLESDELVQNYQQLRFAEGLVKYQKVNKGFVKKNVIWLYGPTGCGKTRRAMEESGDDIWISGKTLKWFDGYFGQEDVIIDDFRKDFCTFHELLRLLDGYPMMVEVKGSSVRWNPKRIWITSCYHPADVYETREDVGQLLRRITDVIKMEHGTEVGGNTSPDLDPEIDIIEGLKK